MPRSARSSIMDWREAGSTMQQHHRIERGTNVSSPTLRFPCIVKHDRWLRSRGWTYVGWMANGSAAPRVSFSQAPPRFSNAGFSVPPGLCQTRGNSRTWLVFLQRKMQRDKGALRPVEQAGWQARVSRQKEPLICVLPDRHYVVISGGPCPNI